MIRSRLRAKYRSAAILAMALCAMFAITTGCRRTTPEQALRRDLSALQTAIEARDAGELRGFLAEDFIGNNGLDREGARRLAALHFMRNSQVGVTVGPLDVAVQGEHATVRSTVVLTGGSGGLLPESGSVYEIRSGWRMEDGAWRMTSLAWTSK